MSDSRPVPALPGRASLGAAAVPRLLRAILPGLALAVILVAIFILQPRAMSYFGLNLLLNLSIPIVFATLAQMFILTVGDLDLSVGGMVSFVATVSVTYLAEQPVLGVAILIGAIALYACVGALIELRRLPAIVVTLGMSFVWFGLAVLVLPSPGGRAPEWLIALMAWKPPVIPLPILAALLIAAIGHIALMTSSYGAILRGAGGNARSIARAGWSMLRVRMTLYALAGFMGVLSGLSLTGITTSADSNIALRYTLISIAGAILGGSEFVGGRVSPIGAVLGALTMTLAASFLSFLRLSPDWQIGVQGAILILVLALRALINAWSARASRRRAGTAAP
ncbi:MAG: ABC transporter permease [Azospirillaceae bacterium]